MKSHALILVLLISATSAGSDESSKSSESSECGDVVCEKHQSCVYVKPTDFVSDCEPVPLCRTTSNRKNKSGGKTKSDGKKLLCSKNEKLRVCGKCEPSCDNLKPSCAGKCEFMKCQCSKGYVRDSKKGCILERECAKTTTACTLYCPKGTKCEIEKSTCYGSYCPTPKQKCVDDGSQPTCQYNEEYKDCNVCEPTCDDQNPTYCTNKCGYGKKDCRCKAGFYRNKDKQCVTKDKCPYKAPTPTCPYNEEYKDCTVCEPTCANQNPTYCTNSCTYGAKECRCMSGFYRNKDKQCVTKDKCPYVPTEPICPYNEEYKDCSTCEPTCDDQNPTYCTNKCAYGKKECRCVSGFYRNKDKQCVAKDKCPYVPPPPPTCATVYCPAGTKCQEEPCYQPPCSTPPKCVSTCGPNEKWEDCGGCEGTCTQQYPVCAAYCRPGQCACNSGYVRQYGKCISKNECPYLGRRK